MKRLLIGLSVLLAAVVVALLLRSVSLSSDPPKMPAEPINLTADSIARHLSRALQFRTISNDLDDPDIEAEFVAFRDWLEATYPRFASATQRTLISDLTMLYAWPGSDEQLEPILLMAHSDVVPVVPGTERDWEHEPFGGEVDEKFIWGRGALDTKGSLIGMVEAAEHLLSEGYSPARTVLFAFGHDEEIGGPEGNRRAAEHLAEEGIRLHWVADEGGVVSEGLVPGAQRPVAVVGIAEKGSMTLTLTAHADGGHSSMPPRVTAIGRLAQALDSLQSKPVPGGIDSITAGLLDVLAPEMPFLQRLVVSNRWLFGSLVESTFSANPMTNALMRTTTAPTIIEGGVKSNVLPSRATAVVNFRLHPRDTPESVLAHVKAVIDDEQVDVEFQGTTRLASKVSPTDADGYRLLERTIHSVYPGALVAPYLVVGGTDSRYYGDLTEQIYRFNPVQIDGSDRARIHGTNERIAISAMEDAVRFYVALIKAGSGS